MDDPAGTLVRLLETLPDEDRRALTAWLLGQFTPAAGVSGTGAAAVTTALAPLPPAAGAAMISRWPELRRQIGNPLSGEDSQLVTIRMPAEQHARLRDWCAEHQFTMAAVI